MENIQIQQLTVLSTMKFRQRRHWDIPRVHILRDKRPSTTACLLGNREKRTEIAGEEQNIMYRAH
jgi:hypothetical protein